MKFLFLLCLLPGLAAAASPPKKRALQPKTKSTVSRKAVRSRSKVPPKKRSLPSPAPSTAEPAGSDPFISDPLVADPLVAEAPKAQEVSEPVEIKFSKGLSLDLQGQYFPEKVSPHVNNALGILQGEINTSLKIGKPFLLKFRPTGRLDPENNSESERYWADVPEGYGQLRFSWDGGSYTTQFGWNTFTWGVTDGFNPVDVVNARRYHDPLRSEKLGALSWTNKLDFGFLLLEGIWIPTQRKSVLPASNSRWLPREIERDTVIDNTLFRVANNHTFYFRDHEELDDALSNNLGARIALKVAGADLGFYAFDGATTVPATNLRLTGAVTAFLPGQSPDLVIDADPPIGIRPIYYRQTVLGATAVKPMGPVLVRGVVAHTKPKRKAANVPVSVTEAALELEHTISRERSSVTLIGLLTYADTEDPENTNSSNSLGRMFDRGVVLGARWQPMETLTAEIFTVFDTRYGSRLHKLEVTKSLSDAWKIYGGGEIFAGKISTPVGVYRGNDRVIAGLKLSL